MAQSWFYFLPLCLLLACKTAGPPADAPLTTNAAVPPPAPFGPLPSAAQLAWHEMEYYGFVHFNMNTFTNMEWGFGGESPELFNPSMLDCRDWARVCKASGMKGIIITAKHHDGFCLWPSAYTEHSVKNSPWKNGKGDVLRELSDACRDYGLKFGVYLSPWDRNHADYGKPEYITYFRNQLRELLTNYGEVFEVWFDGANGGTGYYGGANEDRKVDKKTYYDWENTFKLVKELQPNALIFSDAGPDIRWVGNEEGWANETNWSLLRKADVYVGMPEYLQLRTGHEDGTHWIPAECDVSIRPGWYYHPYEDHKVKTVRELTDIYYHSVGRNGNLLLNIPVDYRGLVNGADVRQLTKLHTVLQADFAKNLALKLKTTASNIRGNSLPYSPDATLDENPNTYWTTDDGVNTASIEIQFPRPTEFNRLVIQEYIALGQRVTAFRVYTRENEQWVPVDTGTTIGYKRILRFDDRTTDRIRVELEAKASPMISNIEVYLAPALLADPVISRDETGLIRLAAADPKVALYYSLDGSDPQKKGKLYEGPFTLPHGGGTVRALTYDPANKRRGDLITQRFGYAKNRWQVTQKSDSPENDAGKIMDDNPHTWWQTGETTGKAAFVVIDLGEEIPVSGFQYLLMQERWIAGFVQEYAFYTSSDGQNWQLRSQGEFSNILNNPILQSKSFNTVQARYIKFEALRLAEGHQTMGIAELELLP